MLLLLLLLLLLLQLVVLLLLLLYMEWCVSAPVSARSKKIETALAMTEDIIWKARLGIGVVGACTTPGVDSSDGVYQPIEAE